MGDADLPIGVFSTSLRDRQVTTPRNLPPVSPLFSVLTYNLISDSRCWLKLVTGVRLG